MTPAHPWIISRRLAEIRAAPGCAAGRGSPLASIVSMLANLNVPLSWTHLAKRTFSEAVSDDILNLAAQQAYYFFFALFPALLTFISIASFFPIGNATGEITNLLARFAPPDVLTIVQEQITKISQSNQGGILTFAFLLTLWSSSGAMLSIITTLNTAYDITEGRPWWKVRVTAIALTIGIAAFILMSIGLVLLGPALADHLATALHLGGAFTVLWSVLQWPVVFAVVATGIGIMYYFAPDAEQEWVWITPGSVLATVAWVVVSLGLKLYIMYFGNYNETYGTIGGVIVLLMWFYLTGVAILFGAEFNAEIEHASPYGKSTGEKVPGEKKKIGVAAQRDYEQRKARGEIPVRPLPDDVNCDLDRAEPKTQPAVRASDLIIGAAVLAPAAVKIAKEIRDTVAERSDADAA
jgi:membrane protein